VFELDAAQQQVLEPVEQDLADEVAQGVAVAADGAGPW
jgi:hypothetical protein